MSVPIPSVSIPNEEQEVAAAPKWELKELKPWHKNMASLIAQGVGRGEIAAIMDCTPEYVTMLARQPKMIDYMRALSDFANLQLESHYEKAVVAIGDALTNGNHKEKIQAARLQMEATRRIGTRGTDTGKSEDTANRLARLAERLLYLQGNTGANAPDVIDGEVVNNEAQYQDGAEDEGRQGTLGNWPV